MLGHEVVIGIPTYRRPALLRALLESLVDEVGGQEVAVIVADNDCGDEVPRVVAQFSPRFSRLLTLGVSERGIAANRNAIVDAAFEHVPRWRYLVMLDDDGQVQPGWYRALTSVASDTSAHVTGAAVVCPLPADAGIFARNSEFALRKRWPTGSVAFLGVAQNTCIDRKVEHLVARPWFDNDYGITGGEDHEFFLRVRRAGGRFAWADDAVVSEPQPPERLSARSVLYRSLTTGITTARIERQYDGRWSCALGTCRYMAMSVASLVLNTLLLRRDKAVRAIIGLAFSLGRLPGMSRVSGRRYDVVART